MFPLTQLFSPRCLTFDIQSQQAQEYILKLNQSIFKYIEMMKAWNSCLGVLTNWVESIKIKPKCPNIQSIRKSGRVDCSQLDWQAAEAKLVSVCMFRRLGNWLFYFGRFNSICHSTKQPFWSFIISTFLKIDCFGFRYPLLTSALVFGQLKLCCLKWPSW